MDEESEYQEINKTKCPEMEIQLNGIPIISLLDTGSQICALSAEWYQQNKKRMGNIPILKILYPCQLY